MKHTLTITVALCTLAPLPVSTASNEGRLRSYSVVATVDLGTGSIRAVAHVVVPAFEVKTANEFSLGSTYRIASLHAGPNTQVEVLPPKKDPGLQKIIIHSDPLPGADLRLDVEYGGPLLLWSKPPINSITPDLIELSFDAYWLPMPSPSERFAVQADISGVPSDMTVVANGNVRRAQGHVLITRSKGDVDLALVAMRGLHRATADGFELYAVDLSTATAKMFKRHGVGAIKFLEPWFGRMPGRPVRVVVVRRERNSGYSRPGYIIVTEQGATDSPRDAVAAKFIAHELSHAWWVCPPCDPRTEDRWLSESIAEYVALRYVETAIGPNAFDEALAAKRAAVANAAPLLGGGERGDAELYNKGPLLLFDLERSIGRARMDKLLAELAPNPPRTTAAFEDALAKIAGKAAAQEFDLTMRQ